jgi:hypothetical protein
MLYARSPAGHRGCAEMEDSGGGWLTYTEAGDRLGVSPEAVRAKAARKRWRRQIGNDGLARIMIPDDLPVTARAREPGQHPVTPRSPPGRKSADAITIKALEAHVETLRAQLVAAEARLAAADARDAQQVADLAAERAQTAKAITAFANLADRLDELAAERARRSWWRRLTG